MRYRLSYREVEELLAERGIDIDPVSIYRWVQTFTQEVIDAARPGRRAAGDRWGRVRPLIKRIAGAGDLTAHRQDRAPVAAYPDVG